MTRLLDDPEFQNKIKCRYTELRETILSDNAIDAFMDSIYNQVYEAQINHYKRWKILGTGTGAPEVEAPSQTYDQEVEKLRAWIDIRLSWLDDNMPGSADSCVIVESVKNKDDIIFRMFPNPATSDLFIESDNQLSKIEVYTLTGKIVHTHHADGSFSIHLNIEHLQPGLYVVRTRTIDGINKSEKLIIQ